MPTPTYINSAGAVTEGDWSDPAQSFAAVTPADATVLTGVRALYVGGAGDVAVRAEGSNTTVTFVGVPAGAVLPIRVGKVMAATTATNIVALY